MVVPDVWQEGQAGQEALVAVLLEGFPQFVGAFVKSESGMFLITVSSELAVAAVRHEIRAHQDRMWRIFDPWSVWIMARHEFLPATLKYVTRSATVLTVHDLSQEVVLGAHGVVVWQRSILIDPLSRFTSLSHGD